MRLYNRIKLLTAASMMVMPQVVCAADGQNSGYNETLITLVSLMLILVLVIGVLATTVRNLGIVVKEKIQKDKSSGSNVIKSVLLLVLLIPTVAFGQDTAHASTGPDVIAGMAAMDFYTLAGVIILELAVVFALTLYINVLLKVLKGVPEEEEAASKATAEKKSWFWDNFNSAVTVEKEKDILLDHDYDGIQELDNSLPPWWKYGFYLTIVVACIYIYRFHISHDGPSSSEEFVAEMQKGEEDKAAYLAKSANNVDETNVVLLTDAASLAAGKENFVRNCAACHLADGGGSVGPNLTDDYWLHGGSVKDVFKSVKYGWQDKGMKSWKDDLSPKQIQEVVSFIRTLKGTTPPAAKAPQGDLYVEATAAPVAVQDTTAAAEKAE